MRTELQPVLKAAKDLPANELPRLLGELEEIRVTAMARLSAPPVPAQQDELIDVEAAAKMLDMGKDYLYHNHKKFPFTRHVGSRVKFSRLGIEKHLKTA
jgi:hypothetical protein